jgi:hypothetical protein
MNKSYKFNNFKNKKMFNIVIIVQDRNVKKQKDIRFVIKNILELLLRKIQTNHMEIVRI